MGEEAPETTQFRQRSNSIPNLPFRRSVSVSSTDESKVPKPMKQPVLERSSSYDGLLASLSQGLSISTNDLSTGDYPGADDTLSQSSSIVENDVYNPRIGRRGSLDTFIAHKEAAKAERQKRKWNNFRVTSWLSSNGHPIMGDCSRISESSEFGPLDNIEVGSISSAVSSAGIQVNQRNKKLSLRELNIVAPTGF